MPVGVRLAEAKSFPTRPHLHNYMHAYIHTYARPRLFQMKKWHYIPKGLFFASICFALCNAAWVVHYVVNTQHTHTNGAAAPFASITMH